jgi:hypothetical protein
MAKRNKVANGATWPIPNPLKGVSIQTRDNTRLVHAKNSRKPEERAMIAPKNEAVGNADGEKGTYIQCVQ